MIFDKYPYTNFHEMNDDWLIQTLREFGKRLDDFVAANSLTYADPIGYDPATTYPAYTVVIYDMAAYVSKQAVPAGMLPAADSDYWLLIFPFGELIQSLVNEGVSAGVNEISERVDTYMQNALDNLPVLVDAWMDDHPEITTPIPNGAVSFLKLDGSLSAILLGAYHDVSVMSGIDNTEFEQGGINLTTGEDLAATNACRTGFITFPKGVVVLRTIAGKNLRVFEYTDADQYVDRVLSHVDVRWNAFASDADHKYRFVIGNEDSSDITPADLPQVVIDYQIYSNSSDAAIKSAIASEYSSASTYNVNDYVFYSGALYRCITAITTAEAWTAAHWETVALADDVSDLKNAYNANIQKLGELFSLSFTEGKYINSANGNIGSASNRYATENYYPVSQGDVLVCNLTENISGECAIAFYDTMKMFLSYEQQSGCKKHIVTQTGYIRFSTISPILPQNAFVKILGNIQALNNDVAELKNSLSSVADIYPNIYSVDDNGYIFASVQSNGSIPANSTCATVFVPCEGNTKYVISKTAGNKFAVGETSTVPVVGGTCTNVVTDNEASSIEYTTSADATYLVVWAWYSSDSVSLFDMLNSVSVKQDDTPTAIDRIARASTANADRSWNFIRYKQQAENDSELYIKQELDMTVSGWTGSNASLSQDDAGVLLTSVNSTGRHTMYKDFSSSPVDLSRSFIGVDLTVHAGTSGELSDFNNISEINVVLSDKNRYDNSTVVYYPLVYNASYILYAGDYKVSTSLDVQRNNGQAEIDLSAVKFIGIQILTKSPYTGLPSITVDRMFAYAYPKKKQVVIGFDGGYASQLIPAEYLKQYDMFGTFYVRQQSMGDTDKMAMSDLVTLQNDGHLVANYARPYGADKYWYQMTLTEKKNAIKYQADWLYANGYGDGADCISVPGGGYASDENELYTSGLAKNITGRILPTATGEPCGFYGPHIAGHSAGPAATNNVRFKIIDSLIKTGGFAIFIFHQCASASADDISLADFKAFADYVKAKRDEGLLEVVTAKDLAAYTLKSAPSLS